MQIKRFIKPMHNLIEQVKEFSGDIYIYGVSLSSRRLFRYLWKSDIMPAGLIAGRGEEIWLGCSFFGKPVISVDAYKNIIIKNEAILLDSFGYALEISNEGLSSFNHISIENSKSLIAYGAGTKGKKVAALSNRLGWGIECFYDSDSRKHGKDIEGIPICSYEYMEKDYSGKSVLVSIEETSAYKVAEDIGRKLGLDEVYVFNESAFPWNTAAIDSDLVVSKDALKNGYIWTNELLFCFMYLNKIGKHIVLWGNGLKVKIVAKRFKTLGITVKYCICNDNRMDSDSELQFCDCYDLLYEDDIDTMVFVLRDAVTLAREFIKNSGLPKEMFIWNENGGLPFPIDYQYCIDPSLGHSAMWGNQCGLFYKKNKLVGINKKSLRIGVLGGSTSDPKFGFVSWSSKLLEIAEKNNIAVEVYNGAISGYAVAQEFVKFARDMSHLNLDIVISFSRVNEIYQEDSHNRFIHPYQSVLFKYLADNSSNSLEMYREKKICYGVGLKNPGEHWLHYENLLAGMCEAVGTKFFAVLQPCLLDTKKELTSFDKTALLHLLYTIKDLKTFSDEMRSIREYALSKGANFSWLIDGGHIFDEAKEPVFIDWCHATEYGNQLIAEWMFNLIKG